MPAHTVYDTDDALAFMDLFPQSPGHVLVIPKRVEARNLLDLDPAALPSLMLAVQTVAERTLMENFDTRLSAASSPASATNCQCPNHRVTLSKLSMTKHC